MSSPATAKISQKQTEESSAERLKIQPWVLEETHRILRVAAANQNATFGEIIDQWAVASEAANA